jgi:hypothetical protein
MMPPVTRTLISGTAAFLLIASAGQAQTRGVASTYIGPAGDVWNEPLNWDNGVPDGDFDAFVNDGGPMVSVFINELIILNNLTIDAGNTVSIDNGRELRMLSYGGSSTIDNAGTLELGATGSNTYLRFDPEEPSATFMLTGGGEVVAGLLAENWLLEVNGQATLHNVDNTIRGGRLRLGGNVLAIINDGLIVSEAGGMVFVDPPVGTYGFTNNGTIRSDGGGLEVSPGEYDNRNGVIEALDGAIVTLLGAEIDGGTLRGVDSGEIQLGGSASVLGLDVADTTIEGTLRINNGRELRTFGAGSLNNTGTIILDATGSNTYLRIDPDVALDVVQLTGGGEIVASDIAQNWILEVNGQAILHNVDNTIRGGTLRLGANALEVINDALIVSGAGGSVIIDPPTGLYGLTNNGIIRADGGGSLVLELGDYDNRDGIIEAINNSIVTLSSATIHGGTLHADSDSEFLVSGSAAILDVSTATPTLDGTLRIDNGRELRTFGAGAVHNTGTIRLDATGSNTYLRFDPDEPFDILELTGGGEIVASDEAINWILEANGNAILHNIDNTIRGGDLRIGANVLQVVNFGTIRADSDAKPIQIDPPTQVPGFDNQGTVEVIGTAGMTIASGDFTTSGTFDIALDSTLERQGDWNQTGGTTSVDGMLTLTSGGTLILMGGTLQGSGVIEGPVDNTNGEVRPGTSAGELTVVGDYTQGTDGALIIELGGTMPGMEHDVLSINGDAFLAGTLQLNVIDGYEPSVGDEFTILTTFGGLVNDQFEFVNCGALYQINYFDTAVVVSVVGEQILGDLNCDGCVDLGDLGILLASYENDGGGDLDGDGDTDLADLGALLANWGQGC